MFQNRLGWPYSWKEIYRFCLALHCNFPSTSSRSGGGGGGGLYLEGPFNGGFFALPDLEGLIHGGAYFRNFTVFTKKCQQQQNFDSDPKEVRHYNHLARVARSMVSANQR